MFGWRPLLFDTFCVYLVREILLLSGKSHGIWTLMSVATMLTVSVLLHEKQFSLIVFFAS